MNKQKLSQAKAILSEGKVRMGATMDEVRVDKLPVGKKLLVRTEGETYTFEKREDGLYVCFPLHLEDPWQKCLDIRSSEKNLISVGEIMNFSITDLMHPDHWMTTSTGKVVEIMEADI